MQDSPTLAYGLPPKLPPVPDIYEVALRTGGLVTWETDFAAGTRTWTGDAIELFGIDAEIGEPIPFDRPDHLTDVIHPEDRSVIAEAREALRANDEVSVSYRVVTDAGVRHVEGRGRVMSRMADGAPQRVVNIVSDVSERIRIGEHNRVLQDELRHRSKNMLGVVLSISRQTASRSASIEDYQGAFERRIEGLASSFNLLTDSAWTGADIAQVVTNQLRPFIARNDDCVTVDCAPLVLNSSAAEKIGMAVHELATNALKYGAWSHAEGRVDIVGHVLPGTGGDRLVLSWTESGGPSVEPPREKGFGSLIAGRMVAAGVGGNVEHAFEPDGVCWTLNVPVEQVRAPN